MSLTENSSVVANDKKWYPETLEISTTPEIAVGTHFHAQHGTKNTSDFFSADRKASVAGPYSQLQSPYNQAAQSTRKHLCLYPQWDRSGLRKPKKDKY